MKIKGKKRTKEHEMLRLIRERTGLDSDTALADRMGMSLSTLCYCNRNPGTWRAYELKALFKVTDMTEEELVQMIL